MSGYCKDCGNQHCVCEDIKKCATSDFQDEVYKALGWQGGTIHQVVAEIKRLRVEELNLIDYRKKYIKGYEYGVY